MKAALKTSADEMNLELESITPGPFLETLHEGVNSVHSILIAFAHSSPKNPGFQFKFPLDDPDIFVRQALQEFPFL